MRYFCNFLGLFIGLHTLHATAQTAPAPTGPAVVSDLSFKQAGAACAHPFGLSTGQQLEYQLLDAKGRPTGSVRYRVLSIKTDTAVVGKKKKKVATTTVKLKSGYYDLSNLVLQQQDLTYTCQRDTVYTDGLGEINYEGLKSFRDRLLAPSGKPLAWPNQPTANTALPKGGAEVKVSSPSVAIAKVNTTVKSRKVLAGPVAVTVPAGTFNCYPVESQRELATAARADLILKNTGREVDYYSPVVGIIKTEYYDKNGKLLQSRVLAKK
ncbi:hypothetical protein GCM10022409_03180 [Hymenobacter glaciei]|uniref:DUF3108 domain-containing protein n=1 Tax=Hymenobacter glaciei TaxID=877209 RepID=A0ABP7T8U1_9BACT